MHPVPNQYQTNGLKVWLGSGGIFGMPEHKANAQVGSRTGEIGQRDTKCKWVFGNVEKTWHEHIKL